MARTNNNQDRTGRQARPVQPTEPPLPWHSASPAHPGPQEPQFTPINGYDVPPTQRPQMGPAQGQLPWPQAAPASGYPQQQAAPAYPPQPQQPYHQAPYPAQGYQQPAAYPDAHYYAPQQDPQQSYQNAPYYPEPQSPHQGYPQHSDASYQQLAAQSAPYQPPNANPSAADPRAYDLGAYATTPAGYADVPPSRTSPAQSGQGYLPELTSHGQHFGHPQQELVQHDDEDYEDDDEYEDDELEPPRRFRFMKIAASLLVATGIGAGGAYAYKKFGLAPAGGTKPTLARAEVPPVRAQSAVDQSGGDTKSGDRLGSQVPAVVPTEGASDGDAPAGPRRVQTIPIMPGAPQQAPQAPTRPTISVPGVALDGMTAPPQAQQPPVTPAPVGRPVAAPPVTQQRAPVAPKVIASSDDLAGAPPKAQPPAQQKVAVAKAPPKAKSNDAFSPNGTTTVAAAPSAVGAPAAPATAAAVVAPAKATSNGYIAVLASQGSAVDARKTLDDLQTRFGEILGGKPTDITEFANPKDGKTYYRAIVGPPGSREAAANICAQMKAAGYKDCFATAY